MLLWTECLYPVKIPIEVLIPHVMVLGDGVFGKQLGLN